MGIYDVPAAGLIEEVAKDLKAKFKQPAYAPYVKTGAHRERAPDNPDWFYSRAASVLYRIYKNGSLGTGALRSYYGGRKNRGVRPEHKVKASGKIIRLALQSLEKEGLLKKDKKGRKITPKGEKLLFEKAKAVEVIFKAAGEKEKAELAERLAKAEQARLKALEARAAQEAARKAAAEQAKKDSEKKVAGRGTPSDQAVAAQGWQGAGQRPAQKISAQVAERHTAEKKGDAKKGHEGDATKESVEKDQKKDFAPAG